MITNTELSHDIHHSYCSHHRFVESDRNLKVKVDGAWQLLWTTEKETLFFAKNGFFGKKVTDIIQTIDFKSSTLNNLISFEGDSSFSVVGSVTAGEIGARYRIHTTEVILIRCIRSY